MVSKQSPTDLIPPKIKEEYYNFKLIHRTSYYLLFDALCYKSNELYTVRVLDLESSLVNTNYDLAATYFVKELLRLCSIDAGSVIISAFEMNELRMAAVTQLSPPIKQASFLKQSKGAKNYFESQNDFQELIQNILSEIEFLTQDQKLTKISHILQPDNLFFIKESGKTFVGDWLRPLESQSGPAELNSMDKLNREDSHGLILEFSSKDASQNNPTHSEMTQELVTLGFTVLKLSGIDDELISTLQKYRETDPLLFKDKLEEILQNMTVADDIKTELRKLLKKNLQIQKPEKKENDSKEEEKKIGVPEKLATTKGIANSKKSNIYTIMNTHHVFDLVDLQQRQQRSSKLILGTCGIPGISGKLKIYDTKKKAEPTTIRGLDRNKID